MIFSFRQKEKEKAREIERLKLRIAELEGTNKPKEPVNAEYTLKCPKDWTKGDDEWTKVCNVFLNAVLSDGSKFFDKFFFREDRTYSRNVIWCLKDASIVQFIDDLHFESVELGMSVKRKASASEQLKSGIDRKLLIDWTDAKEIVKRCDRFIKTLNDLKKRLLEEEVLIPTFSKISYTYLDEFRLVHVVTPERVKPIIDILTFKKFEYLNEYRQYLIESLASKCIKSVKLDYSGSEKRENDIDKIEYDVPTAEVMTYKRFEKLHLEKLQRDAKNEENRDIIEEIRASALQLIQKEDK